MAPELLMSTCVGGAVASAASLVASIVSAPRTIAAELGRFEADRRGQLRRASVLYRFGEPLIDEMVANVNEAFARPIATLARDLPAVGDPTPWRPQEFFAVRLVEALLAAALGALIAAWLWSPSVAIVAGPAVLILYLWQSVQTVKTRAKKRRNQIRRRFTSTFDLVSLMLAVGATFSEAVQAVAEESQEHPLGEELARMLRDTHMGRLRGDALRGFSDRLADADIREVMVSIVEAEELGTPIADTIETQVEQMRLKRTQWAEKVSEESTVKLVFPLMINVLACLVIVASPFLLDYLLQS